jgi:hypothetical protein
VPNATADAVIAAYERYGARGVLAYFVNDPTAIGPFANLYPAELERTLAGAARREGSDA